MRLPSGHQLKAARVLAGLEQRKVAADARLNPTTLHRMEATGKKPIRGHAQNVERVIAVLRKAGVVLTENGVELIGKRGR